MISIKVLQENLKIMQDSMVTAVQAAKNLDNAIEVLNRVDLSGLEDKKIQGYAAEQWQEIVDGGYLCEFSMDGNFTRCPVYCTLQEFAPDGGSASFLPHPAKGVFAYCRPAQIKGVMRPIFVEPVDKDAFCHFFKGSETGTYWIEGIRWSDKHEQDIIAKATKYIEV